MAWKIWGEQIYTADASTGVRVFQPVTFNENVVLRAIRSWFVFYGDPTFTALSLSIYSMEGNTVGSLLHASTNSWTKAQIMTLSNAHKELYFNFNYPTFKGTDKYALVPRLAGYTYSAGSHVAWSSSFPTPVYTLNATVNGMEDLGSCPFTVSFIGDFL